MAAVVGLLVLAGIGAALLLGMLQWVLVLAVLGALPLAGFWLGRRCSGSRGAVPSAPATSKAEQQARAAALERAASAADRRRELESRAVIDAAGGCGWCGARELHRDRYGFPATPLQFHRAEIDALTR